MEEDLTEYTLTTEERLTKGVSRLIVVRHAESIANTKGVYQGQGHDTDLSELGKKQAKALAKRVKEINIKRLISSPLKRTYQTALEVSKLTDHQIEVNELIIETNHGDWEGIDKRQIKSLYPDMYEKWLTKPSQVVFPNGEDFTKTLERVNIFLNLEKFLEDTLLITHDNILKIMITLANRLTLDEIWTHDVEPASLNYFEVNKVAGKNKLRLLKLNDKDHLQGIRADLGKHAL